MKGILILSNMYPSKNSPSYGIFVQNIEHALISEGFDVDVVAVKGRRSSKLKKAVAYWWFYLRALLRVLFTKRIVYIHFVAHTSLPVIIISAVRKLFIVSHVHGGDVMVAPHENPRGEKVKGKLADAILKRSDMVIVPSGFFADFVSEKFSLAKERIFVSPSGGVDSKKFMPSIKVNAMSSGLTLGYVGRIDPGKGVDTLLKACGQLPKGFEFNLIVAGGGKLKEECVSLADSLGLTTQCHFIGECNHAELPKVYNQLDYLIFSTELDESLGLVGLEAMSCGVPIVTTGRAGIGEYFKDGVNGFQYSSGSVDELCTVLMSIPQVSSDNYKVLSNNARETALRFDKLKVDQELANLFSM